MNLSASVSATPASSPSFHIESHHIEVHIEVTMNFPKYINQMNFLPCINHPIIFHCIWNKIETPYADLAF